MTQFLILTSLGVVDVISVLDLDHSNRYVVVSHCCFNLQFLCKLWCWNIFSYAFFLVICVSFLVRCLGLLPIFNWVVHFLTVEFEEFFAYFGNTPFSHVSFIMNIFSHLWLVFSLLHIVFHRPVSNLNEVQLPNDFFHDHAFGVRSYVMVIPMVFYILFGEFCVLHLGFDAFWFNSCEVCKVCAYILFFLHVGCPVPAWFAGKTIFAALYCPYSFFKDQKISWLYLCGPVSGSRFCSIDVFASFHQYHPVLIAVSL